jgi:surface antigen
MKKLSAFAVIFALLIVAVCTAPNSEAAKATPCQCVAYTRSATGIMIYGNGNQWDNNAKAYGYRLSSVPVIGGAINFEAGAYGADKNYGHVGKVTGYKDGGSNWIIQVQHANWPGSMFTDQGCSNVSDKTFTIKKNDATVHYITR